MTTEQALVERDETLPTEAPPATVVDVAAMMRLAVESQLPAESLERIVALAERMEDRAGARAFNVALAEFRHAVPDISHTRVVNTGKYKYSYAELHAIEGIIEPFERAHGFTHTFDSEWEEGKVRATCIIRHVGGHSERTSFAAPVDRKAVMNDTQKAASAVSYACRQALRLAYGLRIVPVMAGAPGEDDDGRQGDVATITENQAFDLQILITDSGANLAKFLEWAGVERVEDMPASFMGAAVEMLEERKRRQGGGS